MSTAEDYSDFEIQLRLQANSETDILKEKPKTRIDDDGIEMEWDEKRKAWFPKLDEDFMASYQINFGVTAASCEEGDSAHAAWLAYASQVARLRAEGDLADPNVREALASAQTALDAYYGSASYRAWYERWYGQQATSRRGEAEGEGEARGQLRFSATMTADQALERAEIEQKLGVPMPTTATDASSPETEARAQDEATQPTARKRPRKEAPAWYEMDDSKNTHVYVAGMPPTITEAEFTELMSKCGIIMNDPLSNLPRIRLYRDQDGNPKGDGRCCYIKVESVELALQILDGMTYQPGYLLRVERAKFQPKVDFDYSKHRRLTGKEKRKLKKQQESLFRWSIDTSKLVRTKSERVIVLKNVFDEKDFVRDVTLIGVVRERVRLQCIKCGVVKKIVVYDTNPEGVVSVTFRYAEEADMAVGFLDKMIFTYPASGTQPEGGTGAPVQCSRQLSAARWDGKERFKMKEAPDEESKRLSQWNSFLEGGELSSSDSEGSPQPEAVSAAPLGCVADFCVSSPVDTDEEGVGVESGEIDSGADTD